MRARHIWTAERVRDLGLTTDVQTAAQILDIGRSKAYELAQAGRFPVKVMVVGRRYLVPVQPLLRALTADGDPEASHPGSRD